ncbi:MAG: hypothetical protein WBO58_15205 [Gammaproteobacteria bacterium]
MDVELCYCEGRGPGNDASSNQDMPAREIYAIHHRVAVLACVHARQATLLECHHEMAI